MAADFAKTLILIRGLPGAGKSTLAKLLSEGGKYPVHAIDDYFTDEKGEYHFNFRDNHLAYKNCEARTEKSMQENHAKIILDNTFTMDWEMNPYFSIASKYNYSVFVFTVENYHGEQNIHHITREQLEKMAEKFRVKLLPG